MCINNISCVMSAENKKSPQIVEKIHPSTESVVRRVEIDRLNWIFDEVVKELRADTRHQQPTKLEQVLEIVRKRANANELVLLDDFVHLFEGTYDARRAASNLLILLNTKLEAHGLHIGSVPGYFVTPLNRR